MSHRLHHSRPRSQVVCVPVLCTHVPARMRSLEPLSGCFGAEGAEIACPNQGEGFMAQLQNLDSNKATQRLPKQAVDQEIKPGSTSHRDFAVSDVPRIHQRIEFHRTRERLLPRCQSNTFLPTIWDMLHLAQGAGLEIENRERHQLAQTVGPFPQTLVHLPRRLQSGLGCCRFSFSRLLQDVEGNQSMQLAMVEQSWNWRSTQ